MSAAALVLPQSKRIPIDLPPGFYRNGTIYQAKNRWYRGNLIRFYQGWIGPIGGWNAKSTSTVHGKARACLPWSDNSKNTWLAIGTESKLYVMSRAGVLSDITPVGFTSGRAFQTGGVGGYGRGLYGAGKYGTPRADPNSVLPASMWTLALFGQILVGIMGEDGIAYAWVPPTTGTPAAAMSGAPINNRGLFVTPERFVMLGGAGGDPRLMQWCDQGDYTTWTPTTTNQARNFPLQTGGKFMLGAVASGYSLILTDVDAWLATYIGNVAVYSFKQVGFGCGAISQGSCASLGSSLVWMSRRGFYTCNGGYVQPLNCDVQDFVFSNMNTLQMSLITCSINSDFGEVTWRYPSKNSTTVNRYVTWNYRENHWVTGVMTRLSACDRGIFQYPMAIDGSGQVYDHETGFGYDNDQPFAESGPWEIGDGDNVSLVRKYIPDGVTVGDVKMFFITSDTPEGTETTYGPYAASTENYLRITARQARLKIQQNAPADFRIGQPRVEIVPMGYR